MEQNKKEIIVDDLEKLRESLVQGYKKVTVTEELSLLMVSMPALINEFYIFTSGSEENPTLHLVIMIIKMTQN